MPFLWVFGVFTKKNFSRVLGLLFGSAGAHTDPKSGQVAPPLPIALEMNDRYDSYYLMIWAISFSCFVFMALSLHEIASFRQSKTYDYSILSGEICKISLKIRCFYSFSPLGNTVFMQCMIPGIVISMVVIA